MKKEKNFVRIQLWVVFVQALVAMLGSLYYSNFGDPVENFKRGELFNRENGLDPCNLCWWARILMYPIVGLSALGLIKNEKAILTYILLLAIPGVVLETYHYFLQKFEISTSQMCTLANPCNAMDVDYFGVITIPFLCLTAFVVIVCAVLTKEKS